MKSITHLMVLALVLGLLALLSSSCTSYKSLKQPYARTLPELKKGDKIKLVLTSGVATGKLVVEEAWPDSVKTANDSRAIPIGNIAQIRKLKFDPFLTAFGLAVPVTLIILLTKSAESIPINLSGKP